MKATMPRRFVIGSAVAVGSLLLPAVTQAETMEMPLTYDGYWEASQPTGPFDTFHSVGFNGPAFESVPVVKASPFRAVFEFDLTGLDAQREVIAATLVLQIPTLGASWGGPAPGADLAFLIHGFDGNGTPNSSDAAIDNVLVRLDTDLSNLLLYEPIDVTDFVQSQLASRNSFAGFMLEGVGGAFANVYKGRSTLSIRSVPEPSTLVLLAIALAGLAGIWRMGHRQSHRSNHRRYA